MIARRHRALALPAALALAAGLACGEPEPGAVARADDRPVEDPGRHYVGSSACRACHPENYESWHASYHRTMTQVPTPEAVKAPFDGRELSFRGYRARLEQRGDEFWVDIVDARPITEQGPQTDERREQHPIALVTGSHHMQIFWHPSGRTRLLAQLPFSYLIEEDQWVPRPSIFLRPPVTGVHLETGRWNTTCLLCHSTNPRPGFYQDADHARTRVSEFGIACEECHGPGLAHAEANRDPLRRYEQHLRQAPEPTIVNPARLGQRRSVDVCGQCHALAIFRSKADTAHFLHRRARYEPGRDLSDERYLVRHGVESLPDVPTLATEIASEDRFWENRFWPDGMIRVTGREANALVDSPCYRGGELTCLSCHDMHPGDDDPRPLSAWADDQLGLGMETDAACVQCHEAARYQRAAHTHHPSASEGARCYNCHMPYTSYGLLKAIRSHQVDSPDARVTLATGRPDACSLCHLDRPLAWTAGHLEAWYGRPAPALPEEWRGVSAAVLWALRGDAVQRALVAWSMGWPAAREASGTAWMPPVLAQLMLGDPYDAVRLLAWRALRSQDGYDALDYDHMAEPDERRRVALIAMRRWGARDATRALRQDGATLVDVTGFRADTFNRLLAQRDDTPLALKE